MGACTISPLRNMQHIARVTPRSHSCKDDINNQAILDLARHIRTQHGDQPMDAMAASLSCEFLARAAAEQPATFRTLARHHR